MNHKMKKLVYTLIKNIEQYDEYCEKLEQLTLNYEVSNDDEIDLLSLLISEYNDRAMEKLILNIDPVDLLIDLLAENNITQLELSKRINISPQLINDVIKYRREITKSLAYKLSEEFKLKYSTFLKPYKLKKAS